MTEERLTATDIKRQMRDRDAYVRDVIHVLSELFLKPITDKAIKIVEAEL